MVSRYGSFFLGDLVPLMAVFHNSNSLISFVLFLSLCLGDHFSRNHWMLCPLMMTINTLGFTLELYSGYMDAAKVCEMFLENLGIIFQGGGGGIWW